jgi:uncharacterized repeat protein (TIGR03803 family)
MNRGAFAVLVVALLLVPVAWSGTRYKVLHAFGRGNDGGGLYGGLVLDAKGKLYGVTSGGGVSNLGTLFELSPGQGGKWTETILHDFCSNPPHCQDGASPTSAPVFDAAGNLYGSSNTATFQLTPDPTTVLGWSFQVIYEVGVGSSLILDQAGNLYGPIGPGQYGKGAVTELSPGSGGWSETYLYSFCPTSCLDGDEPSSALTWDAQGNLYGGTEGGGKGSGGVIFELERTASGWKEHVLHNFPAYSGDAYDPDGAVTLDQQGNLYGTTSQGGRVGSGTVFKLTRGANGGWKETILSNFPNAFQNGGGPMAGVIFDRSGNLYGTTSGGGDPNCQCGVVFKMTPGSTGKWKYIVVHRFTGKDGFDPEASLIMTARETCTAQP